MSTAKRIIVGCSCFIIVIGFISLLSVLFSNTSLFIVIAAVIGSLLSICASMIIILFCFRQVLKIKISLVLSFIYTVIILIIFITYPIVIPFTKNTIYIYSSILLFTIAFYIVLLITNFNESIRTIEY
ncbi:hypothetical protein SHELI_v1c05860 [Spiroplasma helicoides]|uniref:Uncharacterized protein n=1 Tax=Spiroplasma helicoides TaxID=216938 RepID=A0A1B3SKU5_9MOLU|nr:hypothetical protein [Spiroplasma helicoides]AOG60537.1 hypothetical protein SHELI_v1c05860 [Spiroplasma helicoides]